MFVCLEWDEEKCRVGGGRRRGHPRRCPSKESDLRPVIVGVNWAERANNTGSIELIIKEKQHQTHSKKQNKNKSVEISPTQHTVVSLSLNE